MATGSSWKMAQENMVEVSIPEAKKLAQTALQAVGYTEYDANAIGSHVMDAQTRGYGPTGLARILTIAERVGPKPIGSADMIITRETVSSAQLDAKGAIGYLASYRATEMAIKKAKAGGIGIVGVSNTFYAGMLSYYAEMCTRQDLVAMIAGSAAPWVAPHGSSTPRFGTNPLCIAFPSGSKQPIIWDIGTSKIIHAQVKLAQLMGEELPEETAYDEEGEVTKDPFKAMQGAMAVWGGHKGSGLAVAIQLMGALAGAPAHTHESGDWGLLVIVMDPEMFRPIDDFKKEVDSYSETIRSSKPLKGQGPVRMPFDRSYQIREQIREAGSVQVESSVIEGLHKFIEKGKK
ncbi:Malate/L-lactate dehydrogenase [Rhizodiscina lignyota]|uniref:Malate/L-lactate dehydrogenase n=1 Tax=Rhizodiscina lignyota TaxID=1504668 RepID=A0A9P4M3K3_9PEZI|nr:Malate/L-lactate dehydrogenase [Rhizodiscina lignyota]